jgi:TRAP-type C4-dicarboxylate transport system permease small subunit
MAQRNGFSMNMFIRIVTMISQICGIIAAGLIAAGVLVVCQMVFVRYVLNETTIWQTDFTTYCLVGATFIGSPYVLLTHGHVNVDVLPHYLNQRARYWLALASILMSLAFCAVMTVLTFNFWHEAWTQKWVSDTMWRARLWIPYGTMPIGLGLMTLQYIVDLISLVTGRRLPFGLKPKETAEDAARAQAKQALGEVP